MAITTTYDGIEYRSRLEARWAAFMKNIGWDIVYEPFDGDGYIPDFLVQGSRPMLVEVKPAVTLAEYEAAVPKAEKGLAAHWDHDILIVGASPLPGLDSWFGKYFPSAGILGEYVGGAAAWTFESALWCQGTDHGLVVFHQLMDYIGRPCGCCKGHKARAASVPLLESFWADACNDVK